MNKDLIQLTKYHEYYALKQELIKFCDTMDNISDINVNEVSRITLETEVYGRNYASKKVKDLLINLGMLDTTDLKKVDKTYE